MNFNSIVDYLAGHSGSLVLFVAVIYFLIAIATAVKGKWGFALMWTSYAVANIGLYIAER